MASGARTSLVRLALQRRVVVDRPTLRLVGRRHAPLRLLHHVGELVAEQLLTSKAVGLVLARCEMEIGPLRVGERADRLRLRPRVDAHGGEVGPQRLLHLRLHPGRHPLTRRRRGSRRACDRRWRGLASWVRRRGLDRSTRRGSHQALGQRPLTRRPRGTVLRAPGAAGVLPTSIQAHGMALPPPARIDHDGRLCDCARIIYWWNRYGVAVAIESGHDHTDAAYRDQTGRHPIGVRFLDGNQGNVTTQPAHGATDQPRGQPRGQPAGRSGWTPTAV
jgi:hypothetical protein